MSLEFSEAFLPPQAPKNEFDLLRAEVQRELLNNSGVFALVRERLKFSGTDSDLPQLPGFSLDLHYAALSEEEAALLDGKPDQVIGVDLRVAGDGKSADEVLPEMGLLFRTFSYISLGAIRIDGSHVLLRGIDGQFVVPEYDEKTAEYVIPNGQVRKETMEAFSSWMAAHNRFIRTQKAGLPIQIDPRTNVWTGEDLSRIVHFD